jgi:hypothetical protein
VDQQESGTRFLIWAMRQWVSAAVEGRCACHALHAAFTGVRAERAVDDFHLAMRTLCNNVLAPLRFGALDRAEITEHEAVLVATAIATAERDEAEVKAIARQLVHADMAAPFAGALASVIQTFAAAGLSFGVATTGPAAGP